MRYSENGLFNALEKVLRAAEGPLDCHQLYDFPEVREHAASANRVSDYLGNMWRKGLVHRVPTSSADRNRARWAYQWKESSPLLAEAIPYQPKLLVDRPTLMITEEGSTIHLVTPKLTITIKMN